MRGLNIQSERVSILSDRFKVYPLGSSFAAGREDASLEVECLVDSGWLRYPGKVQGAMPMEFADVAISRFDDTFPIPPPTTTQS